MTALLLAGIAKAIDLSAFIAALEGWSTVPRTLAAPLGGTVMACELLFAGSWFLNTSRSAAAIASLALVVTFTGALLFESVMAEVPECHCFGEWFRFEAHRNRLQSLMLRNSTIAVMLVVACIHARKP